MRIVALTLLLLSAMVVFAEPKCRVEWVAPTGEHGHSDWSTYGDAVGAAKLSALLGIPAAVVCKHGRLSERNHPMSKKSKLRVLKDAGARQAEQMLPSRFPLHMQPTKNQLRAYAKKIADVSLARARREVREAASVKS